MAVSSSLIAGPRGDFPPGTSVITHLQDAVPGVSFNLGLEFAIYRAGAGEVRTETSPLETAWLLLGGDAEISSGTLQRTVQRGSLFDEPPTALHVAANTAVALRAGAGGCEWAVVRTPNPNQFGPTLYLPSDVRPEYRGAGLVQNAGLRNVRLIFDRTTRPEANLVLGEVVNYPGRWSSYPPHHHAQPEIYHYRFTRLTGYGHAELGDDVVKVRHGDTTVIPPAHDHAQVAAPGYGMYYLWMIRHLPDNPYTGFSFTPDHTWTLDPAQQGWRPADLPLGLA